MKEVIQHPVYGEIVYTESFWTGKKSITVRGVEAQAVSKKEFLIDGKKATVTGNTFSGVSLCIESETIALTPKMKWYEILLSVLPFVFLMVWGNSAVLCAIFPVIGGAIGGVIGAVAFLVSVLLMKKVKSPVYKLLIGIVIFLLSVLVAYAVAMALILLLA